MHSKMSISRAGRRLLWILLCVVETLPLFAAAPPQAPGKVNVILIVLDQLRADQLHCYGNTRETSPNIDRLAERGVRFAKYFTVASWTSPSFGSLHTSLYASRHGVTLFWRPGMPLINKDTPTLAEDFRDHGYYTAAFVNNALAGKELTGAGFDTYYEGYQEAVNITQRAGLGANAYYSAPATTELVIPWLAKHQNQRFFLYVHYWEPHSPYNPPPEDDIFKSDAYPWLADTGYDVAHASLLRLAMLGDQKAIERLYQLYDGKIHYIDRYVGQILDEVHNLGLDKDTVVALTSDHGELMFSHPKDFLTADHRSLYDTDLHIPLIVAGPQIPQDKVIDGLGSNIDTTPTLLNLAGLPPLADAEGTSLVPMIEGKTTSINHDVYSEEDVEIPERMVRSERYKLIKNLWTGEVQLFDLEQDPGELKNVAEENPSVVKTLSAALAHWMRQNEPSETVQLRRWMIYTQPETTLTVDDQTIGARFQMDGEGWHSDVSIQSGNYGGGCFWTALGNGSNYAIWRSDDPLIGTYKISVFFGRPSVGRLADNAPFTIVTANGSTTVRVNFNQGPGQWHALGTFKNPRYVRLTNAADGTVIADAVRFERLHW